MKVPRIPPLSTMRCIFAILSGVIMSRPFCHTSYLNCLRPNLPIQLHNHRQPRVVAQDTFRNRPRDQRQSWFHSGLLCPSQDDRPHGSQRLSPIPKIGSTLAELFVDELVPLFKIANQRIAVLRVEKNVEKEFGVDGWINSAVARLF